MQHFDKERWRNPLQYWETKTKCACVVDADESTRPRLEGAVHKPHQDHITEKGTNSLNHYCLVQKFIPMPQAMKIPDAKEAVDKEWEKLEKKSSMTADESQKHARGGGRGKEQGQKSSCLRH